MRFAKENRQSVHDLASKLKTIISEQQLERLGREFRRLEE